MGEMRHNLFHGEERASFLSAHSPVKTRRRGKWWTELFDLGHSTVHVATHSASVSQRYRRFQLLQHTREGLRNCLTFSLLEDSNGLFRRREKRENKKREVRIPGHLMMEAEIQFPKSCV